MRGSLWCLTLYLHSSNEIAPSPFESTRAKKSSSRALAMGILDRWNASRSSAFDRRLFWSRSMLLNKSQSCFSACRMNMRNSKMRPVVRTDPSWRDVVFSVPLSSIAPSSFPSAALMTARSSPSAFLSAGLLLSQDVL